MSRHKRRKSTATDTVPAALVHLGGIVRAKAGTEPVFEADSPRERSMIFAVAKGDDEIVITFSAEKIGRRWLFTGFRGTRNGEELDLENDLEKVMELLGGGQPLGTPAGPAIHGTAGTQRNRGVEVRKTTVIRT